MAAKRHGTYYLTYHRFARRELNYFRIGRSRVRRRDGSALAQGRKQL
jgi:hypothetical protein